MYSPYYTSLDHDAICVTITQVGMKADVRYTFVILFFGIKLFQFLRYQLEVAVEKDSNSTI